MSNNLLNKSTTFAVSALNSSYGPLYAGIISIMVLIIVYEVIDHRYEIQIGEFSFTPTSWQDSSTKKCS